MGRVLRILGIVVGALVVIVGVAAGAVYWMSDSRMNQTFEVAVSPPPIPNDSAALAWGAHVATIRGCVDCHGENLGGKTFIEAPPVAMLYASNLTSGEGGVGGTYTDADWDRAIRHGVRPDGKPLLFMPSHEFWPISDEDFAALVAYIKSMPPHAYVRPANKVGPVGRALYVKGDLPLTPAALIDHAATRPAAPPVGPTPEYGRYLAVGCTGCHGATYSGGPIPGAPPEFKPARNITPDEETGIGRWTEEQFVTALRTGQAPGGYTLDPVSMPWRLTAQMTDTELAAIWAYLRTLPAKAYGNR